MSDLFTLPIVTVDNDLVSIFSEQQYPSHQRGGMRLTEQIATANLRLRKSASGYSSDWHVAGDPTLIIIQQGVLRIILRNGEQRDFVAGDAFIAKDYLPDGIEFDTDKHGHRAEVIGHKALQATHIKLG